LEPVAAPSVLLNEGNLSRQPFRRYTKLDKKVRSSEQGKILAILLALIVASMAALPVGTALASAPLQPSDSLKVGPVVTIALDNVGGWGWTGPASQNDSGHLIRLQGGAWRDVPRGDASWGALKNAA